MTSLVKYIVAGVVLVVVIILFALCGKNTYRKPYEWMKSLVKGIKEKAAVRKARKAMAETK
jgi:hypothetical protein